MSRRQSLMRISGRRSLPRGRGQASLIEAFISAANVGITLISEAGRLSNPNSALCHMLGYTASELGDLTLIDLTPVDDLALEMKLALAVVRGEQPRYSLEKRLICKSGEVRWVLLDATFIWQCRTSPMWLDIFVDITQQKHAERALTLERESLAQRVANQTETLRMANTELIRSSASKDTFLANFSHELRTPLTTILGMAEYLLETAISLDDPVQCKMLESVISSGQHLLALINDMLDLSKISAGRLELTLQEVSIRALCESSVNQLHILAEHKGLSVAISYHSSRIMIEADPLRLKQALLNLIANAIKFTPPGGRIGLEVSEDTPAGHLLLTVWDTGLGIASEDMPRLFRPFEQLDSRLSGQYGGTGLGLALASRLIELHGGSIAVTSTPLAGSRFTMLLPLSRARDGAERTVQEGCLQSLPG